MNLLIVESPTKAKTLNRFLGKDYDVTATSGHIKDLPKSKLGVNVEKNFAPDYEIVEKRGAEIAKIKKLSKKAAHVYIATDPDREGEAIASHVEEIIKDTKILRDKDIKKKNLISQSPNILISRIVFHEITQEAVEEAIEHPRKVDKNLVDAQIARRVLDRLVGYNLSPLLWKKIRRGLSAGRVQSVAVRLIVEREGEIEAFKRDEYWEIWATVKNSGQFNVLLVKINEKPAEVKNKAAADKVVDALKKSKYSVFDIRVREVKKHPYPPFTTSTMTQAGARIFSWSAKRTMTIAQILYEKGLITYHRTDSINISQVAINKVRPFIQKEFGEKYLPETTNFYKKTSKVAQEAHEAIRPTDVGNFQFTISNLQNDEKKLYELVWKRFISCQMSDALYDETTIEVLAQKEKDKYLLRTSGQIVKFDGWRKVYKTTKADDEVILPQVKKDEKLELVKIDPLQKFTEPPARFNEASLIKTLEKLGIGRPSTYAPTISTIQIRNYVEKKEGKFFPTPIGKAVNDFLVKNFANIVDYDFTAGMEDNLDKIANGELEWTKNMKAFWDPFEKEIKTVGDKAKRVKIETEKLGKPCPKCKQARLAGDESRQGELVIRIGRFGKFISCSRFPDCKFTEKYVEKIDMKCPLCTKGDVIIKKSKKGRPFYGCSRYPECKWASWQNPLKPKEVEVKTP